MVHVKRDWDDKQGEDKGLIMITVWIEIDGSNPEVSKREFEKGPPSWWHTQMYEHQSGDMY